MKTIRKIMVYILISAILICCNSCKKNESSTPAFPENKSSALVFPEKGKSGVIYSESGYAGQTIREMYDLSENVIIGAVTEDGVIDEKYYKKSVYANVCIEKTLKGEINTEETIMVADIGIIQDGIEISIDGVPLLKKGMRVMLFLNRGRVIKLETEVTSYSIMGATAGKFFCDRNNKFHSVKEFSNTTYTMSDGNIPFTEDEALAWFNTAAS